MFARYGKAKRKRCRNENGLKTREMPRQKVSKETIFTERGLKINL